MELKVKFFSADDIQKKSDFRLWIVLTDGFINKSPSLIQLSIVFREAILALTMAEYKGYTVFLAGHGLGGITPFFFRSEHNLNILNDLHQIVCYYNVLIL
jgi:hypothetical protein